MSPSCIDSMTMDCEDFRCSTNVIQIHDATAGKVNVYAVNGGRRLWDFGLSKGTGTVWVNNR